MFQEAQILDVIHRPHLYDKLYEKEDCEASLITFLRAGWRYINPQKYVGGWHMDVIAEHLEAVTRGHIKRLLINIPPRMTKSSLVSVAWPAWVWLQQREEWQGDENRSPLEGPGIQFLSASYAAPLAIRDAVKARRLIQSPWYQKHWGDRFSLTGDQNAKTRYDNNLGGYRIASSVDGSVTGEGGDVIITDDPNNARDVESDLKREAAIHWWDEVMGSRLNNQMTGAYVVIQQRLAENDVTGHIIDEETKSDEEWVKLILPMRYEPLMHCHTRWIDDDGTETTFDDPRTEEGELLCPERIDEASLKRLEHRLGPFATAGQLQQSPTPRGGGILKAEWWQAWPPHVDQLFTPAGAKLKPVGYPPVEFVLASVDTAMTEKEENDSSAMTVWGLWYDKGDLPNLMLMEAWEERLQMHQLVLKIMTTCRKRGVDRLLIEAKNNGIAAAQEVARLCRAGEWATIAEGVKGDKTARAYAVQATLAGGQVWAPARNEEGEVRFFKWAQQVIDNCALVPKGSHDDLADTVTQAISHFRRTGMLQTPDDRKDELRNRNRPQGERPALYGTGM